MRRAMTVPVTTMLTAGGMAALAPSAAATEIVPRDLTVTVTGLGPENRTVRSMPTCTCRRVWTGGTRRPPC